MPSLLARVAGVRRWQMYRSEECQRFNNAQHVSLGQHWNCTQVGCSSRKECVHVKSTRCMNKATIIVSTCKHKANMTATTCWLHCSSERIATSYCWRSVFRVGSCAAEGASRKQSARLQCFDTGTFLDRRGEGIPQRPLNGEQTASLGSSASTFRVLVEGSPVAADASSGYGCQADVLTN